MAKIYSITVTNAVDGVASSCRACAVGSEQSGSSCVPCPAGHYIDKETNQCKECPPNTYLSIHQMYGQEACVPCGPGSRSTQVVNPLVGMLCVSRDVWEKKREERSSLQADVRDESAVTPYTTVANHVPHKPYPSIFRLSEVYLDPFQA